MHAAVREHMVSLKLLGPADNCLPEPLRLSTRKAVAVIGYLAMCSPAEVQRSHLAALLWGDVPERQARHSLRQTLREIRAALAPHQGDLLATDRETVRLDVTRMRVDARSMEWLVKRGTPVSIRRACALYQSDFLAGLRLQEPVFERWLTGERTRFKALAWAAYRLRLAELLGNGSTPAAVAVALRMVRIDGVAEAPRAALLALCAEGGEFRAVCRHYEAFSRLLWRRFESEPSPALQGLFRQCAGQCGWPLPSRQRTAGPDWQGASTAPGAGEEIVDV